MSVALRPKVVGLGARFHSNYGLVSVVACISGVLLGSAS